MNKLKKNGRSFFGALALLGIALLISACSSGGSGGSSSGVGSSSVQGNVSSFSVAMNSPATRERYSLADFLKDLLPVRSVHADTGVSGVTVAIGQAQTVTDTQGYFHLDGIPPGTHQVMFSKNGQVSSTSVEVGENDLVTMQNVRMNGPHARAQSVSHMSNGAPATSGTPGSPAMPGAPATPNS